MVQTNFSFIQEIKTYKYTKQYVVLAHFSVKYKNKYLCFGRELFLSFYWTSYKMPAIKLLTFASPMLQIFFSQKSPYYSSVYCTVYSI